MVSSELIIPYHALAAALAALIREPTAPYFVEAAPVRLAAGSLRMVCARPATGAHERLAIVYADSPVRPLRASELRLSRADDGRFQVTLRPFGRDTPPIDHIFIPGPGMHRLASTGLPAVLEPTASEARRWSRVAGALSDRVWKRLCSLRFAIIGAGRTGSMVADVLIRSGVQQLTLIDPDRMALPNLDMAGVSPRDLTQFKVRAVRETLLRSSPQAHVTPLPESVLSLAVLPHLKAADVLISTVDHDQARVAVAFLASTLGLVHLDIATGVGRETMAADVRLMLPGSGCLLCRGGLASDAEARAILSATPSLPVPWHEQRAGSLPSLNAVAVGLGTRLIEDLVAERVFDSRWLHLEFDRDGTAQLRSIPLQRRDCLLCHHYARGDAALGEAMAIIRQALEPQTSAGPASVSTQAAAS